MSLMAAISQKDLVSSPHQKDPESQSCADSVLVGPLWNAGARNWVSTEPSGVGYIAQVDSEMPVVQKNIQGQFQEKEGSLWCVLQCRKYLAKSSCRPKANEVQG